MDFKELLQLSVSGVYALINDSNRRVYVSYGTSIIDSLQRLIRDLKKPDTKLKLLKEDLEKLRFVILETCDEDKMKPLYTYYTEQFIEKGFETYRNYKSTKYKVRITLGPDLKVHVQLVNKSRKIITVGVFHHVHNAETFVRINYSKPYIYPIYAKNELTQQFILANS